MTTKLQAFKEAVADTSIGMLTNVPINFALVSMAFHFGWGATLTTIVMTATFTTLAIIRKMAVRMHFAKTHQEKAKSRL